MITIHQGISKFDQELLNSAVVPDCLASTLQVVEFGTVEELEPNLSLAKFFMENGMVLERMSFSLGFGWKSRSKFIEEFKEKLYSFKEARVSDVKVRTMFLICDFVPA
ncbi:F-box/FBD/LRR-repeat protein, partial [Trifolium medium]|nr:F-box/FBD/LRR-repeat protein [Trifolium medium]